MRSLRQVGLRRVLQAMTGVSCPVCLLAVVVSIALTGLSVGAVLIDHARSQQMAALSAKGVADIARQRTVDLMSRIDSTLRAVEDSVTTAAPSAAAVEAVIAQRRRAEPRLLGLYLIDRSGQLVAGSTTAATRSGAVIPACLRGDQPDADQVALRGMTLDQPGGGQLRGICVARGIRRDGFSGAVLVVVAADLLAAQFADLAIGAHGSLVVLDENLRPLALVGTGFPVAVDLAGIRLPDWDAVLRGASIEPRTGTLSEARRIEAPFGAVVGLIVPDEDAMAVWKARSQLVLSSAFIVLMFVGLATIAVRNCEQRERGRMDRLAALTLELEGGAAAAPGRAAALAGELADAERVEPGTVAVDLVRPPESSLPGAAMVRIGQDVLRHRGGGFTAADLTFLAVLGRVVGARQGAAERIAGGEAQLASARADVEDIRRTLEAVLLEMPDATFTLDGNWRFVAANRNAAKLFGEYAEDIRGRRIWDIFPELEGSVFETECRRALDGRHAAEFEMKWLRTETWLMVHVHPRDGGLVVYLQDISRQVATDDKLRQVGKMEAIGRLTGGIAHDFNNLLTVILGNIEMLDFELPETGEAREMHDQVRRAAQSAAELTHQLLAFARRQPLSPSEVDVARLVVGLDGLLRRTLGATVQLDIRTSPTLWRARVDPTQLENAIVNLAINARDAIPNGRNGRLAIEATNIVIRKPETDMFGELKPGNYVVISVSDNGTGIPRDLLGKVIEPFFTTKPAGRGTGLGLAMVYGYVTQSGGHVRIVSEEGRGTTVRLYLPGLGEARAVEPPPPAPAPAIAAPAPARPAEDIVLPEPRAHGERILLVEDSDMVRGYTRNVLVSLGYDVTVAADGLEALGLLERGVKPDLLLTDVLLPNGMDGLQVAEQVLRRMPGLPVLYMSGYVENIDIHKSKLDPQTNLLLKPFRRANLAAMVRARLDATVPR